MKAGSAHPKVVALVPAWKASGFIGETMKALAAQTCPNLEILISDDASPDDTAAICERYAARDARFRLIRQPRNLGWTGNVNALLTAARGDYLLFAFHDDLLEPEYVQRCVAALEANPRAIMAFSDITLIHQDGHREEKSYAVIDGVTVRLRRARLVAQLRGPWWVPNRGVFRAAAARTIGGLRRHDAGEFTADWPWLLHMSLLGEFVRIPERLCTKIYQPLSLSRQWMADMRRQWKADMRAWRAVTLSAMKAVSRSEIPKREKLVLYGTLARTLARRFGRPIRTATRRRLRRLGLRRSTPISEPPGRGHAGRFTN